MTVKIISYMNNSWFVAKIIYLKPTPIFCFFDFLKCACPSNCKTKQSSFFFPDLSDSFTGQ